jgi:hypothetical protein
MKRVINLANFEAYYLDFYEGNLSESQIQELLSFLDENPSLKTPFNLIDFHLDTELTDHFPDSKKEELFQFSIQDTPVYASSLSFFQTANIDGILPPEKKKELELFEQSNAKYQQSATLFEQTKLAPDFSIVFENKNKLKQPYRGVFTMKRFMYAAACILVFIFFINQNEQATNTGSTTVSIKPNPNKKGVKPRTNNSANGNYVPTESVEYLPAFSAAKKQSQEKSLEIKEDALIVDQFTIVPLPTDSLKATPNTVDVATIFPEDFIQTKEEEDRQDVTHNVASTDIIEHKQFPLLSKLFNKYFHINLGLGKKKRLHSDEYYLVIGTFEVSRNISK